jgi:hypothetical protein
MKSNRCECGSKKERGVEKCLKCTAKELSAAFSIPPDWTVSVATEEAMDIEEVMQGTCISEDIKMMVKKKECPIKAVESRAKIITKPKRKKRVSK